MFLLQNDIFFWDLCILLLMTLLLCGAIVCALWLKKHPRKPFQRMFIYPLYALSLFCFLLVLYGSFIEPQLMIVTKKTITHRLASPMKVVVISDLHVGAYKGEAYLQRVVNRINNLLPDIVLIPGDFILSKESNLSELTPLQDIHAPMGTYAVLGNHDMGEYAMLNGGRYSGDNPGDKITTKLSDLGITVLRNTAKEIQLSTGKIAVAGIDDVWSKTSSITDALNDIDPSAYTILLAHNPSIIDDPKSHDAHLIISGHTHGGQIRLPGIGSISPLPTSLGKAYDQGIFDIDSDTQLAITRGIGESSARARLFAIPEVLLLTINP